MCGEILGVEGEDLEGRQASHPVAPQIGGARGGRARGGEERGVCALRRLRGRNAGGRAQSAGLTMLCSGRCAFELNRDALS